MKSEEEGTAAKITGNIVIMVVLVGAALLGVANITWLADHITGFAKDPNKVDAVWGILNFLVLYLLFTYTTRIRS